MTMLLLTMDRQTRRGVAGVRGVVWDVSGGSVGGCICSSQHMCALDIFAGSSSSNSNNSSFGSPFLSRTSPNIRIGEIKNSKGEG